MWRATVLERIADGQVVVSIPKLYRGDPIGPIQSAVDAQVGDDVIVADLVPDARVNDWWVVGYESQIGRWGNPYPHEHPTGQVTAVDANGQPTTLTAILAQKADKADVPGAVDTSGYATKEELAGYTSDSELTTALSAYTTTSTLTTQLSGKADAPGAWATCSVTTNITLDTAAGSPTLAIRDTPLGWQLRGRYRLANAVTMDTVMFTLPTAFVPNHPVIINVPTMGPGTAYAALTYQFEVQTNRSVTARQDMLSGARMSFNHIMTQ